MVDLDLVAAELQDRRIEWEMRGLDVGAFTWRDAQASWPQPLVTDRSLVADPESLGIKMGAGPDRFAELILWIGGWADRGCYIDGEDVVETPEYQNVAECVAVAEDLVNQLLEGWVSQRSVEQR